MQLKKNIKLGKIKIFSSIVFLFLIFFTPKSNSSNNLEGNNTSIKILDKISSKNILINLKNGEDTRHKDLLIKSIKYYIFIKFIIPGTVDD